MPDYLITTRKLRRGNFTAEPGPTRFLKSPTNELLVPSHAIARRKCVDEVLTLAHTYQDPQTGEDCGDHYNAQFAAADGNGHSWYFSDTVFLKDLRQTLAGDLDRHVIGTRRIDPQGILQLV